MIISGINTGIATDNVEESAKFYVDTLGFTIKHKLDIPGCKVYVMENEYTEFDLIEGAAYKPGSSSVRITVRNFDDSVNEAKESGLTPAGDVMESDRVKVAPFTNANGTCFMISHHKKVNIFV